jgi:hypothetical protein
MITSRIRIGLVAAIAGTVIVTVGSFAGQPTVPSGTPKIATPPSHARTAPVEPSLSDSANACDARVEGQWIA